MKSITFTTFALTAAVLSTLASGLAPSTAAAADYGYVNYRNYDKGPESLTAFRARTNATAGTATPGAVSTTEAAMGYPKQPAAVPRASHPPVPNSVMPGIAICSPSSGSIIAASPMPAGESDKH